MQYYFAGYRPSVGQNAIKIVVTSDSIAVENLIEFPVITHNKPLKNRRSGLAVDCPKGRSLRANEVPEVCPQINRSCGFKKRTIFACDRSLGFS